MQCKFKLGAYGETVFCRYCGRKATYRGRSIVATCRAEQPPDTGEIEGCEDAREHGKFLIASASSLLWPHTGGAAWSLDAYLTSLAASGHCVVAYYSGGTPPPAEVINGVRYIFCENATPAEVVAAATECKPNLLITGSNGFWEAAAKWPGHKLARVAYWRGLVPLASAVHCDLRPSEHFEVLANFDGVLTNSTFSRDLLARLGVPAQRIAIARPPHHMSTEPNDTARSKVLIVGYNKMRKDIVQALQREFDTEVLAYDSPESDHLAPDVMLAKFRQAAVLAHPTFLSESYSRVMAEAMSAGCSIVYTALGHPARLVGDSAGIGLPLTATTDEWLTAVRRAIKTGCNGNPAALQRAAWITEHDDWALALEHAATSAVNANPCGLDVDLLLPPHPGCRTAVEHFSSVHNVRTVECAPAKFKLLIVSAWNNDVMGRLQSLSARGRVGVWWQSALAQSELGDELVRLNEAINAVRKGKLWCLFASSKPLADLLQAQHVRCYWLPNVVAPGLVSVPESYSPGERPAVGLLAAGVGRKNHANALAACALAKATPHVFDRMLQHAGYKALIAALQLQPVAHDVHVRDKQKSYDVFAGLTCTMHMSHSETWCYSAAESILCGTPAITSSAVPCVENLQDGIVAHEQPASAAELITKLHTDTVARTALANKQRLNMLELSFRNELVSRASLIRALQ